MHDSGLGYRRIAKRLRDMNIKTARGSVFKNNNVFAVIKRYEERQVRIRDCLLYTSPSPRDGLLSRMPSSA